MLLEMLLEECIAIRNGEDDVRACEGGRGGIELADVGFDDLDALSSKFFCSTTSRIANEPPDMTLGFVGKGCDDSPCKSGGSPD